MKWLKSKNTLIIVCLLAYAIIVILPPLINGYIYPNSGDDAALHLSIIKSGSYWNQLYLGYVFIGYPLKWLGGNINHTFMWFNYIILIIAGYSIYFVLSKLFDYKVGLLALYVSVFISLGIISEFSFGEIFNIINMGIILPFILYFGFKWYGSSKIWYFVATLILTILFSLFHTSGIYFVPVILTVSVVMVVKRKFNKRLLFGFIVLFIVASVCDLWILNKTLAGLPVLANNSFAGKTVPLDLIVTTISPFVIIVILLNLKSIKYSNVLLVVICILTVIGVSIMGISPTPDRQLYDLAIIVSFAVAIIVGQLRGKMFYISIAILAIGFMLIMPQWFSYQSAVKPVDELAFAYINQLDDKTFTTSPDVTVLIYEQYTNKQFVKDNADIYISRSEPMTSNSDIKSISYPFAEHGDDNINNYYLVKTFNGSVQINIYMKKMIK